MNLALCDYPTRCTVENIVNSSNKNTWHSYSIFGTLIVQASQHSHFTDSKIRIDRQRDNKLVSESAAHGS